jgi:hypothetical protein
MSKNECRDLALILLTGAIIIGCALAADVIGGWLATPWAYNADAILMWLLR